MSTTHAPGSYSQRTTEPLLTQADLAEYLNVSRWTVARMISRGDLPAVRVGDRRRFRREDVDAFLERNREAIP